MAREKDGKEAKEGKDGKSRKRELAEAAARRSALEAIAEQFKALGDPTRLAVVMYLRVRAADAGQQALLPLSDPGTDADDEEEAAEQDERTGGIPAGAATVGEIGCHVFGTEKAASTLSHHLKELRRVGLVRMKRRGKNMLCSVAPEAVARLAAYLQGLPGGGEGLTAPPSGRDDERPGEHDGSDAVGAATTPR